MSIFGRALGAVGRAGNQMASKYIDEQLAQQRAQFMADLQHQNMVKADQYQNSDERRGRLREQATQDTLATEGAKDDAALRRLKNEPLNQAARDKETADARAARGAKVEELNDPLLQQALDAEKRRTAERDATIQRDQVKAAAADPGYLEASKTIALSDPKAQAQIQAARAQAANAFANAEQTRQQTEQIRRVNDLTKEMQRTLDDPKLSDTERAQRLAGLQSKLAVMGAGGKKGEGGSVTEEVEEKIDPSTGQVIERTRKTKGPLGAAGAAGAGDDPLAREKAVIDKAFADGKGPDLVKKMEAQKLSPQEIVQRIGLERYEEVKRAQKEDAKKASGDSIVERADPRRDGPPSEFEQRRQQILAAEAEKQRQAEQARNTPENQRLAQLEEQRKRALRAGDAASANEIQQQINALR